MNKTRVSVAMATYNGDRFLQEQLDSLARQTLLPCELVACDDGSTDGTLDILHQFAAKAPFPVHVHQNQARLGYGPNFLRAASLCSGELLAFCDQDDVWLEHKLQRCAAIMADPQNSLVIHSAEVVDQHLVPVGFRTSKIEHSVCLDAGAGRSWRPIAQRLGEALDWVLGCTCVFRSRLLREVPPAPPFAGPGIHHEKWLQFAAEIGGSVVLIPEPLLLYRQHERNVWGYQRGVRPAPEIVAWLMVGEAAYVRQAGVASDDAEILGGVVVHSSKAKLRLKRAQEWHESRAKFLEMRASLYSKSTPLSAVVALLCSMVLRGSYRARSEAGLGLRGLAKDILMPTLQRAASRRRHKVSDRADDLALSQSGSHRAGSKRRTD